MRIQGPYSVKRRHVRCFHLRLDPLEDRALPATVNWIVDTDGFWDVSGNWSTGAVPGPDDDVVIDRATPVTVTHRTGSDTVRSISGRNLLVISSASTLTVPGAIDVTGGVTLLGGTLSQAHLSAGTTVRSAQGVLDRTIVDGTIDLASDMPQSTARWLGVSGGMTLNGTVLLGSDNGGLNGRFGFDGTQTLGGTGTIRVGQSAGASSFSPGQFSGVTATIGPGITFRGGTASIGTDGATVVNQGTIITSGMAPNSGANTIVLKNFVNSGTIRAESGAGLRPFGTWSNFGTIHIEGGGELVLAGSYHNAGVLEAVNSNTTFDSDFTLADLGVFHRTGGSVDLLRATLDNRGTTLALDDTTGSWNLAAGVVLGGTVSTAGSARLFARPRSSPSTLDGVTINGTLDMTPEGSGLSVTHGLTLDGTLHVGAGNSLRFTDSSTLDGTGTVLLDGHPYDNTVGPIFGASGGHTLHIGPHVAIRGGGAFDNGVHNGGAVVTEGVIDAGINGLLFTGVAVNGQGGIVTDPAGTLVLDGNLLGNTTNPAGFQPLGRTLVIGGDQIAPLSLEVMSADRGAAVAGFGHNFAYGTLEIDANRALQLVDQSDNAAGSTQEALYVDALIVHSGATLNLNGLNVYARAVQIDGTVVGGTVMQVPDSGPISFGTATAGTLGVAGELDEWTFFGRRGQAVAAVVNPGGGTPTPPAPTLQWAEARLLGPDGAVLADQSNTDAAQVVTLAGLILPADGTYRFQVRAPAGHVTSFGHYQVTLWNATSADGVLQVNERTTGHIGTTFAVDRWHFAADAGQQVRFHLLGVSDAALAFRLTGPTGVTVFDDQSADTDVLTLPAGGTYTLSAYSHTGQTGDYAFTLLSSTATELTPGIPLAGSLGGQGSFRLFRVHLATPGSLAFDLSEASPDEHLELYVRQSGPPTRTNFQYRSADPQQSRQQVLLPYAAAGDWYVLVYGDPATLPGQYQLTASTGSLIVTGVTPDRSGDGADTLLTVSGLGFTPGTTVELRDAGGTAFGGAVENVAPDRLTARFSAHSVPPGTYSVRVTRPGGSTAQLDNAVHIVAGGVPQFDVHLDAPAALPVHATSAVLYLEYTNNGDAAMPAPVVTLHANNHALMTLDHSLVVGGFETPQEPDGYGDTVQVLATGAAPGLLQPGESMRVPVYWAGELQPFDFSPVNFTLAVSTADQTDPIDWTALQTSLQPPHMSAEVWAVVFANFHSQIGSTWGDYVQMLDDNAAYLARLGESVTDVRRLFGFELQQADGLTPVRTLTSATDAAMPTPGLGLSFDRVYANSIAGHYQTGPFGRGWFSPWQETLQRQTDGTLYIVGPGGAERRFQPNRRGPWGPGPNVYVPLPGDHGALTDADGGAFLLTELDGTARRFRPDGKLEYVQDTNGNRITAGYDAAGRLVSLTHSSGQSLTIAYNAAGLIASVTDSAIPARTTTFTYDAANEHLVAVEEPDGRVTHYTYSIGAGAVREHALTSIQSPGGGIVNFVYDDHGRLASSVLNDGTGRVDYGYDSAGGVTVTDPAGQGELFFDDRGLMVKIRDPLGNTSRAGFDEQFNRTRLTGADGLASTFDYDAAGNVVRSTDAAGNVTAFTYGPLNRLTSLTDALSHATKFDYDPNGNLVRTTYPDSSSERIVPDAFGDAASFISRNGAVISYTRNAAGQVTSRTFADNTHQDYTYDARGNLRTAADATGTTTFDYDAGDRLTRVTYPDGRFLVYTYDTTGRRTRMVDQDGFAVKYAYDAVGRLADLTDDGGARIDHYTYDALGRLSREDKGNGTFTTYEYDAAGQLLHLVNHAPNGSVNSRFDYTFDAIGRRTTMTTLDGSWAYSYDAIGQLAHADFTSTNPAVPSQDLRYEYDAVGNRTRTVLSGTVTDYTTNRLNQYTQVGGADYAYDLDGNLTSITDADGTTSYNYDALDRLTGVSSAAGSWAYKYDPLGERTASTHDGQRTDYLIDPTGDGWVVGEFAGGSAVAHYTIGLGLISRGGASGTSYYDFDALGSTAGLSNAAGAYVDRYTYLPFGELQSASESVANPFQFVGRAGVLHEGEGLNFMRARFYAAGAGRFVSTDPLRLGGGDVNLYRYALNSPEDFVDPRGSQSGSIGSYLADQAVDLAAGVAAAAAAAAGAAAADSIAVTEATAGLAEVAATSAWTAGLAAAAVVGVTIGNTLDHLDQHYNPGQTFGDKLANSTYYPPWSAGPPPGSQLVFPLPFLGGFWLPPGIPPGPNQPRQPRPTPTPRPRDPNSLTGPAGVGAANFVPGDAVLPYRIDFENDATATAPAQRVDVTDQLSSDLDWTTLEFTEVGFHNTLVSIPAGSRHFRTELPVTFNGRDFQVEIELNFDPNSGLITASFQSLDPTTGLPPDVLTGFLPPEDGTGRGQGHLSCAIKPRADRPSGTAIRNVALVRFDFLETIATDQVDPHDPILGTDPAKQALATIDAGIPTSTMAALPATVNSASVGLRWPGQDEANGSGIVGYDVYVSDNGGDYVPFLIDTSATSAAIRGQPGHTYSFYSIATDGVGHRQTTFTPVSTTFGLPVVGNKQTLTDDDGDVYTLTLSGPGQMQFLPDDPDLNGRAAIGLVELQGTDPAKSKLSVAIKKARTGDGRVSIGTIEGTGLRAIAAGSSDVLAAINLTGPLGSLAVRDVKAGVTIHATGDASQQTSVATHVIEDNTTFEFGTSITSFTAAAVGTGSIVAPSIGSLKVKGDARNKSAPIHGDFNSDLTLHGSGDPKKPITLKSATIASSVGPSTWNFAGSAGAIAISGGVSGWNLDVEGSLHRLGLGTVDDASIRVGGKLASVTAKRWDAGLLTAGSIGTLSVVGNFGADLTVTGAGVVPGKPALTSVAVAGTVLGSRIVVAGTVDAFDAGAFVDSSLLTGFTPTDPADPLAGGVFTPGANLNSFRLTGLKNSTAPALVNSTIGADGMGRVSIKSLATDNNGREFGLLTHTTIKSLTVTHPALSLKNVLGDPNLPAEFGDFVVKVD